MAFSATTDWDVQTGGSDNNGGGFDSASTGTNGSLSTTPIFSYSDLVIGATTTQATSVARAFTSTDVGNVLNVTSGTGFTVQRVQISSVSAGVATFDKSLGTAASTGGSGVLGGCLATTAKAAGIGLVAGNDIYIKAGTYSQTITITLSGISGSFGFPISFIGYQTTHGDNGTKPLLTTATNNIPNFSVANAGNIIWRNISFSNTAATRAAGILGVTTSGAGYWSFIDCVFDGHTSSVDCSTNGRGPSNMYAYRSTFKNASVNGIGDVLMQPIIDKCTFYNITGIGYRGNPSSSGAYLYISGSIFAKCGTAISDVGTNRPVNFSIINCTFVDCTSSGILSTENTAPFGVALILTGNIFYNCVTGVNFAANIDRQVITNAYNAYGGNTTNRINLSAGLNDFVLTADPFTNRSTPDYSLNNTAGGGALIRAANYPGVLNIGGTGYSDVGALQHQDTGGGGSSTLAATFS